MLTTHDCADLLASLQDDEDTILAEQEAKTKASNDCDIEAYLAGETNLRFRRLNLICCYDRVEFEIWKQATFDLIAMKPVTREFAKAYIHKMREAKCPKNSTSDTDHNIPAK
jgi:hypothetical protein